MTEPIEPKPSTSLPLAAQQLRVSYEVARRLLLQGKLQGWRTSSGWRVTEASIAKYLQDNPTPTH